MIDIAMYFATVPPILIPVSERAIKMLGLPEGVDGILIMDEPENIISAFPADYIVGAATEVPRVVVLAGLEVLH